MNIELITELDDEDGTPTIRKINIGIEEDSSMEKLLSKIHEITKIPKFKELKWGNKIEKVSCTYFFKSSPDNYSFEMIDELDKRISDFPKNGKNGELSVYINLGVGLAN